MRAVLRLSQIARTFSSAAGGPKSTVTSASKPADPLKNVSGCFDFLIYLLFFSMIDK